MTKKEALKKIKELEEFVENSDDECELYIRDDYKEIYSLLIEDKKENTVLAVDTIDEIINGDGARFYDTENYS